MKRAIGELVDPLRAYVRQLLEADVVNERSAQLRSGSAFISRQLAESGHANLTFICTHNSRRSHLAHVWSDTAAGFYGLEGVHSYSGGIEATACNERTVGALRRAGFSVVMATSTENPVYLVQGFESAPPIECFSKVYSVKGNPLAGFAAMMCCSDVDDECPIVEGAAVRIALHYDDPKEADNTAEETSRYDQRCMQIARDMFHMMAMVG